MVSADATIKQGFREMVLFTGDIGESEFKSGIVGDIMKKEIVKRELENKLFRLFIKITCKLGWHLWFVARSGDKEIARICDCCGKIGKRMIK